MSKFKTFEFAMYQQLFKNIYLVFITTYMAFTWHQAL